MDDGAEKNGFGPVCDQRDKRKERIVKAQLGVIVCSIVLLGIYRMLSYERDLVFTMADFYFMTGASLAIILSEGIRRCCLFAEEYYHIKKRYNGSFSDAFKACLSLQRHKALVGIVFCVSLAYTLKSFFHGTYAYSILLFLVIATSFSLFSNLLGIDGTTVVEISEQNELQPKNVSAGAAWMYYFGYLKVVLPDFSTIFEKARGNKFTIDGENIRDKVSDTRLFIIIPKDGYCYKEFSLVDDRIQFQHTMPELKRSRGGVAERIYKNSLYKVEIEDKEPKYVTIEYASPLLTFYDMANHAKVSFTNEEKEREIVQFYLKLRRIINSDPECIGKCKFILTGPVATNDIDQERRLADIIYEEIK